MLTNGDLPAIDYWRMKCEALELHLKDASSRLETVQAELDRYNNDTFPRERERHAATVDRWVKTATEEAERADRAELQVGELIDGIRSAFLAIDRVHPVDDDQMSRLCDVTKILHDALRKSGVTEKRNDERQKCPKCQRPSLFPFGPDGLCVHCDPTPKEA